MSRKHNEWPKMSGTPLTAKNGRNEDMKDLFHSPINQSNESIDSNIEDATEPESPTKGTNLATKFAFSLPADVPETLTMAEMTIPKIENPAEKNSLLHRGSFASNGGTPVISTMENGLKTPEKTTTIPLNTPSPRAKNLAAMMKSNESGFENGYDSDGEKGPFNFMEEFEGPQDFEEVDHSERIEVSESASKSSGDGDVEDKK